MIRCGFLDSELRKDLIELAWDGLVAHCLAWRANALVLLDYHTIRTWHRLHEEDGIEGVASFSYEGGDCPAERRTAERLEGLDQQERVNNFTPCWLSVMMRESQHNCDLPLDEVLPIILRTTVSEVARPFANPRHAHEFKLTSPPSWAWAEKPQMRGEIPQGSPVQGRSFQPAIEWAVIITRARHAKNQDKQEVNVMPTADAPAVPTGGQTPVLPDAIEARTMRKVAWRILPLITVCYLINQIDRVNVAFAALTMNADLHLTPEAFGFGAGLFFLGYIVFQLPSNFVLAKAGARVAVFWIMLAWGVVAMGMALITSATGFAVMRFLLGLAEGGFLPGMILYLTHWFPTRYRAHTLGLFITAAPLSSAVSGPLSNLFLSMNGVGGLRGWQWLFLGEGIPAIVLAFVVRGIMTDHPQAAAWLSATERHWLDDKLEAERRAVARHGGYSFWYAFRSTRVLLLSVIYAALGPGIYGVVLWLPQMLKSTGLDNMQIGLLSVIPYALGALGMVLWCRRSDRQDERRMHTAIPGFVAALGLMAGAYAGGVLGNPLLALAALTVAMIGVWAMIGVFWTLPSQFVTGLAAAAGIAVVNCCGAIGSFTGPYLVGWIRGTTGSFTLALLALATCALVAALLALLIPADPVNASEAR